MEIRLRLLIEQLTKKEQILETIAIFTENQQMLLRQGGTLEVLEAFREISVQKQASIEKVLQIDEVFNRTFQQISDFEGEVGKYPTYIEEMKALVEKVTDLDVHIRVLENENNQLIGEETKENKESSPSPERLDIYKRFSKDKLDNENEKGYYGK